jgi:hypothetical protein
MPKLNLEIITNRCQDDQFVFQTGLSPEENYLAWHSMLCSERSAANDRYPTQTEAKLLFEERYDVTLDLETFFKKITKTS